MNWTKIAEDVLTAGLAAVPSFLGSAASSGMGYYQTRNLMDYQQRLNQQMIHSANRYNSPLSQMQRLEAAGLNKNLVYGSGVDGNQSSPGSVGLGKTNPQLELPIAENYFRKKQIENETKLANANEQNILANQALTEAKTLNEMIEYAKQDETFLTYVAQQRANLDHTLQSIQESKQRTDESAQRTNNLKIVANSLVEQVRYWKAHANNEELYQPDLLKARAYEAWTRGDLNNAQWNVAQTIMSLNEAKRQQVFALIDKINLEAGNEALEFEIAQGMKNIGLGGIKPRDLLTVLMYIITHLGD